MATANRQQAAKPTPASPATWAALRLAGMGALEGSAGWG